MDVECLKNVFSIIFVDFKDYMKTFKDCVDEKGKPKALTECLTVKEIKERLNKVKYKEFYITDTDSSQLDALVLYFNNMMPKYAENGDFIRTDLFGFNNKGYDDLIIAYFLMHVYQTDTTAELITNIKKFSDKIISLQSDRDAFYTDSEIEAVRKYPLPYVTVDIQQVYGLHTAGVNVDKEGNRNKFGKSLKQTSINLKWHELLDFTLPDVDIEECEKYWWNFDKCRGMLPAYIQQHYVHSDFDRYILPKYIPPMMYYNRNDVFLVLEAIRQKPDEIQLRYSITKSFGVNVLCSARANIADKLTLSFYSKMSGLKEQAFKHLRTERHKLSFDKIIFPHISFKTPQLQKFLAEIKGVSIYHTNSDSFKRELEFMGTRYTIATGGIHSQDKPRVLKSNDKYTYLHHDYTSYYPSIMISYKLCPKHLNQGVFTKMLSYLKDTRVKCKHTKDEDGFVIPGVPNKIGAEALKIVINSIYGKLGSELFFLYDRFVQMQVTINGQLMTMTLIEELELNGIHVVSANTDGIVIKLPNDKFDVYKDITDRWNEFNKMGADYEEYDQIVSRDVNNYFDIQKDGTIEYKGALDPKQYLKDLKKGYDMPVVAKAVFEYFVNNIPVAETLRNHKDILDFCKTQNVGKQFDVVYNKIIDGKVVEIKSQRHIRYYVSLKGVIVQKKHIDNNTYSKLASGKPVIILNSLDDMDISNRNIDYSYYIEECYKIIDPIKLGISANQKGDKIKGTKSGKVILKRNTRQYNSLFDDSDLFDNE